MSTENELRMLNLESSATTSVLEDEFVRHYDVARDGNRVVYSVTGQDGRREIRLAPIDRREPPHLIARDGDEPSFGPNGYLLFRSLEGEANFLARISEDGSGREHVSETPIIEKFGVSPDGGWVGVSVSRTGERGALETVAIPIDGRARQRICWDHCSVKWSPDGRFLYLGAVGLANAQTLVVPIPLGRVLPLIPATGLSITQAQTPDEIDLPDVMVIDRNRVAPGPIPSKYAFVRIQFQRNLFRIPLN
jgi:hypothetical protein